MATMSGVSLSAQKIYGMGDCSELGKVEGLLFGTKLVSLEGSTDGAIDTDGNI